MLSERAPRPSERAAQRGDDLRAEGISASFASLKDCRPKGIPIRVMQKSTPIAAAPSAIGIPLKSSQSRLASSEAAPPP